MPQHMFQDPAGTIPAILPGQPVGLVVRQAGLQDASQATALSKPTLARRPRIGLRMLQNRNVFDSIPLGPQSAPNFVNGFGISSSSDGLTVDVLDRGLENGEPFAVVKVTGTNTLGATKFLNIQNNDVVSGSSPITISAKVALIDGFLSPDSDNDPNVKLYGAFRRGGLSVNGTAGIIPLQQSLESFSFTSTNTDGSTPVDQVASRGLYFRIPVGRSVDATIKIVALQSELGTVKTPFQTVFNPNEIIQPGVPDLWHLYNDGGDSLNAVFPAGTYGRVSCGIDLVPVFDTFVSDGTTPINTLRHERQVYHHARLGAFSETEMSALRKWIQEKL